MKQARKRLAGLAPCPRYMPCAVRHGSAVVRRSGYAGSVLLPPGPRSPRECHPYAIKRPQEAARNVLEHALAAACCWWRQACSAAPWQVSRTGRAGSGGRRVAGWFCGTASAANGHAGAANAITSHEPRRVQARCPIHQRQDPAAMVSVGMSCLNMNGEPMGYVAQA